MTLRDKIAKEPSLPHNNTTEIATIHPLAVCVMVSCSQPVLLQLLALFCEQTL